MEPSAFIMGAVILGGLGFYYWYSFARHGGMDGYVKNHLALREGEKLLKYFVGSYHLETEKKDYALAAVGVARYGKPLQLGLTDQDRLVFRENASVMADEAVSLEKNQVSSVRLSEEEFGGLVGLTGRIEKMRTVYIMLNDDQEIKLDMANSCGEAIVEWAKKEKSPDF